MRSPLSAQATQGASSQSSDKQTALYYATLDAHISIQICICIQIGNCISYHHLIFAFGCLHCLSEHHEAHLNPGTLGLETFNNWTEEAFQPIYIAHWI